MSKEKPIIDRFFLETKQWIAKKVEAYEVVKYNIGTEEHEKSRKELNIIKECIMSEVGGLSDKECTRMLFFFHKYYK